MPLTRRSILRTLAAVSPLFGPAPWPATPARAQSSVPQSRHGLSLFGDLKYPPGFRHFDYVNPQAPKGGGVRFVALGTFDNFNQAIAGTRGLFAAAAGTICDTLMVPALDEASAYYGLIAEAVSHPADFAHTSFRLRAGARHHDGKPITVEDVIYSFEVYKKFNPFIGAFYRDVVRVEQSGEREVTFTMDSPGNREMPVILGQLRILPKHWWEGSDASGKKRDIGATTLEPPLGNGAYRIKEFVAGRMVVYGRVKDYWANGLNINIGRDNFDEIRYEYFRDPTVALEAFKADHADWRAENSAKNWATAYDFPAVKEKRVILGEFPQRDRGIMRAFAFNTRRDKLNDARVRRAFNFAFDFEEMNRQFFFGQYKRINSYFEGTELACSGLPQGEELNILELLRDKVPPEVFTIPYANPVAGTPENVRANLREGMRLMREAGYEVRDQKQVNSRTGEVLRVRDSQRHERPVGIRTLHQFLQASAYSSRYRRHRAKCRRYPIRESITQLRFRYHHRHMAAVPVARQRATRLVELSGGRYARLAQLRRHQGSGGRRLGRARDFCQQPWRADSGHQGARPRPAVEPLRRAAIHR